MTKKPEEGKSFKKWLEWRLQKIKADPGLEVKLAPGWWKALAAVGTQNEEALRDELDKAKRRRSYHEHNASSLRDRLIDQKRQAKQVSERRDQLKRDYDHFRRRVQGAEDRAAKAERELKRLKEMMAKTFVKYVLADVDEKAEVSAMELVQMEDAAKVFENKK